MHKCRLVGIAVSKNKVPIRLNKERWFHIIDNHDYMAGMSDHVLETIENPELIVKGSKSELIALKKLNKNVRIFHPVYDWWHTCHVTN